MLAPDEAQKLKSAFTPGHPEFELWPELDRRPGDLVVNKTRFSGFVPGTSALDDLLKGARHRHARHHRHAHQLLLRVDRA